MAPHRRLLCFRPCTNSPTDPKSLSGFIRQLCRPLYLTDLVLVTKLVLRVSSSHQSRSILFYRWSTLRIRNTMTSTHTLISPTWVPSPTGNSTLRLSSPVICRLDMSHFNHAALTNCMSLTGYLCRPLKDVSRRISIIIRTFIAIIYVKGSSGRWPQSKVFLLVAPMDSFSPLFITLYCIFRVMLSTTCLLLLLISM